MPRNVYRMRRIQTAGGVSQKYPGLTLHGTGRWKENPEAYKEYGLHRPDWVGKILQ